MNVTPVGIACCKKATLAFTESGLGGAPNVLLYKVETVINEVAKSFIVIG